MALYVAKQSGDFNTAGTWNQTSTVDAAALDNTSSTSFSATPRTSQTFTAPSLVDSCIGGVFFAAITPSFTGTFTLKLQEYDGVSAWVDKATETVAYTALRYLGSEMCPIYIKFTTPYTYATTTASYYRFEITAPGTGSDGRLATVGTTPGMIAVDDRTGAPGIADDVVIVGECRAGANVAVTATGTVEFGGNIRTGAPVVSGTDPTRTFRAALVLGYNGEFVVDHTATNSVTINGQFIQYDASKFTCGTDANQVTFTNPTTLLFSKAQPNGYWYHRGEMSAVGTERDVRRVYASGAGTAADPLIIDAAADWEVDDEIVVTEVGTSATNYNNCQYRFIKTVNSTTSFVVSSTVGGAEAALTNTRTYAGGNSHIINLERSIKIGGESGSGANSPQWHINGNASFASSAYLQRYDVTMRHWRFEDVGVVNYYQKGSASALATTQYTVEIDGGVFYAMTGVATFGENNMSVVDRYTYNNLTFVKSTASAAAFNTSAAFATFNNFNVIDHTNGGTQINGAAFNYLNDWVWAACNKGNGGGSAALVIRLTGSSVEAKVIRGDVYASRGTATLNNDSTGLVNPEFIDCDIGTRGDLTGSAIAIISSGPLLHLINCRKQASKNWTTGTGGSFASTNTEDVDREDFTYRYSYNYEVQICGAGLSDTTTRTSGSYCARLRGSQTTAVGGVGLYSFYVLAEPDKAVSVFGFAKKAAALVGEDCAVRLTLPFETVHAEEVILTDDTNWNLWAVSATYTGTLTSFARVDIIVPSVASGYLYIDDIYNGTNALTALDMIYQAQPSPVMTNTLGDPNAVWQVLRDSATITGTFGEALQDSYQAKVWMSDDNAAGADRYVVAWFKNGTPLTSGITSPLLQVAKQSDGTDLVAATAMSAIGSTGAFKYDEATNRLADGAAYLAVASATIGGATRTWMQPISRDSTA